MNDFTVWDKETDMGDSGAKKPPPNVFLCIKNKSLTKPKSILIRSIVNICNGVTTQRESAVHENR